MKPVRLKIFVSSVQKEFKQTFSYAKIKGRINNAQYRDITGTSARTALRELRHLTSLGILDKVGGTGQATHYAIAKAKPIVEQKENPS